MLKSNVFLISLLFSALSNAQLLKFSVYDTDMKNVTCQSDSQSFSTRESIVEKLKLKGITAKSLLAYPQFEMEHLLDIYYASELIPKSINLLSNSDWKDIRVIYRPNLNAVANAFIAIGPMWFEFSSLHRRAIILHELFHRLSTRVNDMAYSQKWLDASESFINARWLGRRWQMEVGAQENFVSQYAMTNPSEDFAETVNQYRVAPFKLLSSHPIKYQFIKEEIFYGQEFLNDSDCDFNPIHGRQQMIEAQIIEFITNNKKDVRQQVRKSDGLKPALLVLLNKKYLAKLFLENSKNLNFLQQTWASRYL
jgi:hypothetical protein